MNILLPVPRMLLSYINLISRTIIRFIELNSMIWNGFRIIIQKKSFIISLMASGYLEMDIEQQKEKNVFIGSLREIMPFYGVFVYRF